ncbi:amidohydrolase family protein [Bradyrhizobium prioriisuperbiae]|uniref:amidohydrolase family protein n=1 Tax=Bradyrhizobium prioriisuperbiae TaxID=2854389 RepID=UPI0028E73826|nr:amidohydrolase family protein [Bradyrhizobium prioritasuperba]
MKIDLDVHTHLIPVHDGALSRFDGVVWDSDTQKLSIDGHAVGIKSLFHVKQLLAWMDAHDVAHAWVSIPPPAYRPHLPADEAAAWIRALNDGLATMVSKHAPRLSPLLHLPVEHPSIAVETAAAAIAQGHVRFSMSAGGVERVLSAPDYHPLWQALHAASGFLFLHPGEGCDPRLDAFYLHNLLGNPMETAIAASHLVFAGVLEQYPDMTICLAHAGGATAMLAARWEQGHATARPGLDPKREAPGRALRRFCVDCIAHDAEALELAGYVFGEDKILFGSDWPFPMGLLEPRRQLSGVTPTQLKAIWCDNPQSLDRK